MAPLKRPVGPPYGALEEAHRAALWSPIIGPATEGGLLSTPGLHRAALWASSRAPQAGKENEKTLQFFIFPFRAWGRPKAGQKKSSVAKKEQRYKLTRKAVSFRGGISGVELTQVLPLWGPTVGPAPEGERPPSESTCRVAPSLQRTTFWPS